MAKPVIPSDLLKAIAATGSATKAPIQGAKRPEADPKSGASEIQSIRPARTAIAHLRGGNKGK